MDIGPILACTHNEKWQIRHPAISALAKAEHTSAKARIREIILQGQEDHKKYSFEFVYANVVLGQIGTLEDIDVLQLSLKSRIRDVKGSAEYAIESIQNR